MVDEFELPHLLAGLEGMQQRVGNELTHRATVDGVQLRGAEGRILDLLGDRGARPTELVDGAWITKQAIGKRIRDLEERGLVEVVDDPEDGRAVIVSRTPLGEDVWSRAMTVIADIEAGLAAEVGPERYAVFRSVLDELASDFVPGPPRVRRSGDGPRSAARRTKT